jgi:heme-degrading monooxygenase HmoA
MPVLMIAEQPNMDEETYASMLEPLMPLLRSANGFMSHTGGPSPAGGMRIIEIWESEADQQKFFNENLKSLLPPGLVPDITYHELRVAFTR